jgi:exopolysaccharide biosynthesis predicted pyruvyltransferase EpsI
MRDIISTFPDKDIISLPAYVPYKAVSATLDEMDLMTISSSDFSMSTNK